MKEFIDFLKNHKILSKLKKIYLKNSSSSDDFTFLNSADELFSHSYDKVNNNLDKLAKVYEHEVPYDHRKKLGEIYTPYDIIDQILDGVGFFNKNCDGSKKVIDISCGSGSFLIRIVKRMINFKREKNDFLDLTELKALINVIKSRIFGIDINPIACILCQINLLYEVYDIINLIHTKEPAFPIPVFSVENTNVFLKNFNQKYDFIVGNPPYLFIREIPQDQKELINSRELVTSRGQYDYYQLFIEIGIKLLKSNGILGFIVPDSILALSNRRIIRKYIYEHTIIKEIHYLGPQFDDPVVANIILILQRESDQNKIAKNIVTVKIKKGSATSSNFIPQNYFKDWNYKFLINLNHQDREILNHLNKNFPNLKIVMQDSNFTLFIKRGVELTKEGKIIYCDICNKYYPLPKDKLECKICKTQLSPTLIEQIIIDHKPHNQTMKFAPFIYSVNRFHIKEDKFIILDKEGINYKNPENYKDRIIIRQISQNNLICATFAKNGYTSQSLYNLSILKSPVPEFNNYYLLGLINSELLSYYFIKSFGSYKNIYPRILIEKIKELPIKIPKTENEKQKSILIANNVKAELELMNNEPILSDQYQLKINNLIYNLYQISDKEREHIRKFLEKCE